MVLAIQRNGKNWFSVVYKCKKDFTLSKKYIQHVLLRTVSTVLGEGNPLFTVTQTLRILEMEGP